MKTTITKIFLGAFILISGNAMSQDDLQQKHPFSVESTIS